MDKCSEKAFQIMHYTLCSFIPSLLSHIYLIIIVLNQHKNPGKYNSSSNIGPLGSYWMQKTWLQFVSIQ